MGVNPDVWVMPETVVHDAAEYTVSIGITGYAVDNVIRALIIKPVAFIDLGVCRFRGWQKSEVANNLIVILNYKTAILLHVSRNDNFGRVAFSPLVHIARLPHYVLCSIHDFHDISHVRWLGFSDNPTHVPYCLIK
jgi:hypothetical protein